MKLETLEQYLDGALDASETRSIDAAVAADAVLAGRVERLRTQRALRAAALSTYSPGTDESRILAMAAIDACHEQNARPVGRVGFAWMKKIGAAAAVLVIAAVSFYAGRNTASPTIAGGTSDTPDKVVVYVKLPGGEILEERVFNGMKEATAWVDSQNQTPVEETPAVEDGTQIGGVM